RDWSSDVCSSDLVTSQAFGIASITPQMPAMLPAANIKVITVSGCTLSALPITLGVIKLPSICCSTSIIIATYTAIIGSWNRAIMMAGVTAIYGPKNGITLVTTPIKANKNE